MSLHGLVSQYLVVLPREPAVQDSAPPLSDPQGGAAEGV